MAVKIRLTRNGRHNDANYRIVVADSRFARDGRYIEQIGYYDPAKGEESAVIDEELALAWLAKGAKPSDSIRALFNRKGLMAKANKVEKVAKGK
jgi:small subunit ribosomal protein S16